MIDKIVVLSVIASSPFTPSVGNSICQNNIPYTIEDSNELISKYTQLYYNDENFQLKENRINISALEYTTCKNYDIVDPEYWDNIGILNEFLTLDNNWDGYGSFAPLKNIVTFVMLILPKLPKQPDIFPTPDGHVQIEYAIGKNKHLNIEFLSEKEFTIFEMFEDRSAKKDFYSYNLQLLNNRIRRFYETI